MFPTEYPFYLAKDSYPYTKIGRRNAAIYWGNNFVDGLEEGKIPFGNSEELVFVSTDIQENPGQYTKASGIFTELIIGWWPFSLIDFALDLSQEKIEISEMLPRVGHKVVYRKYEPGNIWSTLPLIEAEIFGNKYLFQVDIGDRYTSVPKQMVEGIVPIRTEVQQPYGSFRQRRKIDIYRVPIRLSQDVEIMTEAVVMSDRDYSGFIYTGTNGCIGVDLIRNHRVTFTPAIEDDEEPAMYFKPFKKIPHTPKP